MAERRHYDTEIISELAVLGAGLRTVQEDVREIKLKLENTYVSRETFELRVGRIEKIVYTVVALVLTAVVGALLKLVMI